MQDVSEIFRGSGFKIFARILGKQPNSGGVGDPGAWRRLARVLRPDEFVGAGRGPAGAWLHHLSAGAMAFWIQRSQTKKQYVTK